MLEISRPYFGFTPSGNCIKGCFLKNSHEISAVPSPKVNQSTDLGFTIRKAEDIYIRINENNTDSINVFKFLFIQKVKIFFPQHRLILMPKMLFFEKNT